MEGITLLVSIILIVFGVLQIILFFKLWGMTNDVRKIKVHIAPKDDNLNESTSLNSTQVGIIAVVVVIVIVSLLSTILN